MLNHISRRSIALSVSLLASALLVMGCAGRPRSSSSADPQSLMPPQPTREFRAAWVATVANIDWPTRPGLSTKEQQRQIIAILDKAVELKLNAIVLQVRTSCDAFYPSELEPWSEYLTGRQGQPPEPFYDPLKMWVDEAHKRGIELHAWFNPYRARAGAATSEPSPRHVSKTNPSIVKSFNEWQWLDPGEPAAQDLTYNVFLDVVKRYDVDGIHIDDYFYPYPSYLEKPAPTTGPTTKPTTQPTTGPATTTAPVEKPEFPDEPSWSRYKSSGGTLSRADWRRHNVDQLIERIYKGIKREKPHVQFGISPFGIAKSGVPSTVKPGFNQYEELYADAQLWLNKGWCDYFTPQLYWTVRSTQPYGDLLRWWSNENTMGRHLWPGLFTSRVGDGSESSFVNHDILEQIAVTREISGATGHVHFSMKALQREPAREGERRGEGRRGRGRRGRRPETQPTTAPTAAPTTNPTTAPTTSPTTQPDRTTIGQALKTGVYTQAALVPATPWLDAKAPAAPRFEVSKMWKSDATVNVSWQPRGNEPARVWAVHAKYKSAWKLHVFPSDARSATLGTDPVLGKVMAVSVSAVDRSGNMSKLERAKMPR